MKKINQLDKTEVKKQLLNIKSFITWDNIMKIDLKLKKQNISLEEMIGCNELDIVIKGYDTYNSRNVAVKIILNQQSSKLKDLEEEIQFFRKDQSEYIITIFDYFYDEDSCCQIIVMEYCSNGNLLSYVNKKNNLSEEEIVILFSKYILALQYIHKQGITYHNLQPQNILLTEKNQPKICNLGLSYQNNKIFTQNDFKASHGLSNEQINIKTRLDSYLNSAASILFFLQGLKTNNNKGQLKNNILPENAQQKNIEFIEISFQNIETNPKQLQNTNDQKILEFKDISFQNIQSIPVQNAKPKFAKAQNVLPEFVKSINKNVEKNTINIKKQNKSEKKYENIFVKQIISHSNQDTCEDEWFQKNDKDLLQINNNNKFSIVTQEAEEGSYLVNFNTESDDQFEEECKDEKINEQVTKNENNTNKQIVQSINIIKNGIGVVHLQHGNRYEGEIKDNQAHGKGTYYFNDGSKHIGMWENNKRNGQGVLFLKNGERFEGEYFDDKKNGYGTFFYNDGSKYVGQWKDGKRNGQGILFLNGDKYQGGYKDDKKSGQGVYYYSDGSKYIGQWLNGKRNGKGIFYFSTGDRYEGEFKDDKASGLGTFYQKDGKKSFGEWQSNKKICS